MEELINILKNETKTLREQFIEMTKTWATNRFKVMQDRLDWKDVDWCNYFGIEPRLANASCPTLSFLTFPKGFHNTKQAREYESARNEMFSIVKLRLSGYIEKEVLNAEKHYENSITKLADRISKKNLDITKLKVVTSHIGVNINTTLTDGTQTVRAFTIIASGMVQRPHYRYLIK